MLLTVRDNGPGIAPAARERIFDPFYTSKEVGAGTGLGLAIVQGVVERHRGRIELRSEPGCTEFVVMDHDTDTPLKWLQCIDLPEIAFLVIEPEQILLSYALDIPEPVLAFLGWQKETGDPRDVIVFVILTVLDSNLTANLRAPVVVNVKKRRAQQMILDDPEIPLQHPVRPNPTTTAEREAG